MQRISLEAMQRISLNLFTIHYGNGEGAENHRIEEMESPFYYITNGKSLSDLVSFYV